MFSEPYLYYYLVASFFTFMQQRMLKINNDNYGEIIAPSSAATITFTCALGGVAKFVFFVLGFWFMPAWWYPLAFFGLSIATTALISFMFNEKIASAIGVVAVPVFSILMYLDLFEII